MDVDTAVRPTTDILKKLVKYFPHVTSGVAESETTRNSTGCCSSNRRRHSSIVNRVMHGHEDYFITSVSWM